MQLASVNMCDPFKKQTPCLVGIRSICEGYLFFLRCAPEETGERTKRQLSSPIKSAVRLRADSPVNLFGHGQTSNSHISIQL